jgi:hypothetical protein
METTENVFDTWMKNSNKMMNDWKNMADQWTGEQGNSWQNMGNMQKQWMDNFQGMMRNMTSPFSNQFNPFTDNTSREAFFNMLRSTDVYTRLFQLWQPVFSQMQNNSTSMNPEDLWKMIDPANFRSFVDKLFGIDQNAMMNSFMDQYRRSTQFFNSMSQMNPGMNNWYTDVFRSAQAGFAPYFNQTNNGSRPTSAPLWEDMETWGKYVSKMNEMQAMLYKASMSAWEKVLQAMSERSASGNPLNNFDEFYSEWSSINEKEYLDLFNTDEYAALQGELLELQVKLSRSYEKQMETFLQPFPVVLRSQLEDLYKMNHELRTRINDLESMIEDFKEQMRNKSDQGTQ